MKRENAESAESFAVQIGARIRSARRRAELTQRELAERIGMRFAAPLSCVENGRNFPSVPTLARICEAVGCTPNELLAPDADTKAQKHAARAIEISRAAADEIKGLYGDILLHNGERAKGGK